VLQLTTYIGSGGNVNFPHHLASMQRISAVTYLHMHPTKIIRTWNIALADPLLFKYNHSDSNHICLFKNRNF